LLVFGFDKVFGIARRLGAFLQLQNAAAHNGGGAALPESERQGGALEERQRRTRLRPTSEHKKRLRAEIRSKKRDL
jgi:hypothetical protein